MNALIERDDIILIIAALDVYLNEGAPKASEDRAVKLTKAFLDLLKTSEDNELWQLV